MKQLFEPSQRVWIPGKDFQGIVRGIHFDIVEGWSYTIIWQNALDLTNAHDQFSQNDLVTAQPRPVRSRNCAAIMSLDFVKKSPRIGRKRNRRKPKR